MKDRAMGKVPKEGVVLIIGLSTNTVWRNYFQPLLSNAAFAQVAPFIKYSRNSPTGTMFGEEFSVVGASNEASWLSIQGMTVAYANGDEAVAWPKSFWDMLISRLTLDYSRLLVTCNPGSSSHYLKAVIDSGDPDVHAEKFLLRDNPFLPTAVVARLERSYTGIFRRRMIEAEWVAAEGAVFEAWDPDTMVKPQAEGTVLCVGIDYGTNHPSAGYALTTHGEGLQFSHEWSPQVGNLGGRTRLTDHELADDLESWLADLPNKPRYIYLDPAAASFKEELRRRGIVTNKADNKVVDGIRTMDSLLTSGDLTVSATCTNLIDEIPGYRWDPKATERGKDAPVKEKDDHVDAARYALRSSRHLWARHLKSPAAA